MNFLKLLPKLLLLTTLSLSLNNAAYSMKNDNNKKRKQHDEINDKNKKNKTDDDSEKNQKIIQKTYSEEANKKLLLAVQEYNQNFEYIQSLLESDTDPADPNTKGNFGWRLVHYAASEAKPKTLQLLIKYNADLNIKDIFDRSPLYCSMNNEPKKNQEQEEIVKLLLDHGAQFMAYNMNEIKETALHHAVGNGNLTIVNFLLEYIKNLPMTKKLQYLCEDPIFKLEAQTFLCCLKKIQNRINLRVPKPVVQLMLLQVRNLLEKFINMPDGKEKTAFEGTSNPEIMKYIETFKKNNNLK